MVVFTCQKCNSTLKKNAVEKHNSCRPFLLTCIDCLKDFRGSEYDEHKSCITESQKYGGSNFVLKPQGVKQQKWCSDAKKAIEKLVHIERYKNTCSVLKDAANIPRNRVKFHNFMKSIFRKSYIPAIANEIYNFMEEERSKTKDNNEADNSKRLPIPDKMSKENESVRDQTESISNEKKSEKKKKKKKGGDLKVEDESEAQNHKSESCLSETSITNDAVIKEKKTRINEGLKKKRPLPDTELQTTDADNFDTSTKRKKEGKKRNKNHSQQNKENEENGKINIKEDQNKSDEDQSYEDVEKIGETKSENGGMDMLSKKELKMLKKQKKYEAEIAKIENFQKNMENGEFKPQEKVKKKKKKNTEYEAEASSSNSPKRKHEETNSNEEVRGKKIKLNETLPDEEIPIDPGKKFKWGNVIKQILASNPNKEMPLKKLRKKVLNEYRAQRGDDMLFEKLLGIFNKKVNNTVGIKVLKDKAQLTDLYS